jgi:hypothetical protein
VLFEKRNMAAHESDTGIEQHDAEDAVRLINEVLSHLRGSDGTEK